MIVGGIVHIIGIMRKSDVTKMGGLICMAIMGFVIFGLYIAQFVFVYNKEGQ